MRRAMSLTTFGLVLAAAAALAGCATEQAPAPTVEPPETSPTEAAPTETAPAPEPSDEATAFEMPAACEEAFAPEMFARLIGSEETPLNHEGVTMYSTEVAGALEVLDTVDSLRCSWGPPSDHGIVTTIAEVSAEQAGAVRDALIAQGFTCEPGARVTRCALFQTVPSGEESPGIETGETHLLGDGGWVATRILNVAAEPEYSDSIVQALWP